MALRRQVPHVLRQTGADAWARRRSLTEIQASATPSQRRSCRPPECVFGVSPSQRFSRLCVAALPDALGRLRPPLRPPALLHRWTPIASCSLARLIGCPVPSPGKVIWRAGLPKHGPAHDLTRNDLRDLDPWVGHRPTGSAHWLLTS